MLWEVEIFAAPGYPDVIGNETVADAADLGLSNRLSIHFAHGYLVQGELTQNQVQMLAEKFLADAVVEQFVLHAVDSSNSQNPSDSGEKIVYVLPKPGVTDTVADNAKKTMLEFGIQTEAVRTFKKYRISGAEDAKVKQLAQKLLANDAIEQFYLDFLPFDRLQLGSPYQFNLITVPIRSMNDDELATLSKKGQLFLSLTEMQTIRDHFIQLDRDPTDIELETIAQTWSEHCSHKTLAGRISYSGPEGERVFQNMLKETIFAATVQVRKNLGPLDFCVSVFSDNAGVVKFDNDYNVCFKVETHNHPSALEPYGGANTGIGGVIRDPMGTGMGAKPICNTDIFCFAPPAWDENLTQTNPSDQSSKSQSLKSESTEQLPPGVLHPRRIIKGVVAGVRDYGNRMGIPTVNGAVYFDRRYLGNPLVYCGNVGLIPVDQSFKNPQPGDYIVAMGGRTGRDGIHGATFSSAELTSDSETLSGGAVQIGNAITEKMVLDILLEARDRGLYNAVTDCGAGGFSSAVGEMGEKIGAEVNLDAIPLKYEGLSYTEMWISEAQERMVFSVPKEKWLELKALSDSEGVETVILGEFKPTGRLELKYNGTKVADLTMAFLHDGRPPVVRQAVYETVPTLPLAPLLENQELPGQTAVSPIYFVINDSNDANLHERLAKWEKEANKTKWTADLETILSSLNVSSKHWIVRQYDHEVQGGSVIKPLVGVANDGPGDAAVLRPRISSRQGLVISCGMNPHYGDFDTYHMAASAIDEAVRNAVAVGADPATLTVLDNFCWGNTDRPETLGSLVHASLACYDLSVGLGIPFISGKDSLNNEFRPNGAKEPISIPPSLLISAMGQMPDVSRAVSMDLKKAGNAIYLIGETKNELGGSHFSLVRNLMGGQVPTVDIEVARRTFYAVYQTIQKGLVRSVHDLSEGGLAVSAAEMAFAGNLGAEIWLEHLPSPLKPGDAEHLSRVPGVEENEFDDFVRLFSESNSRFLIEVPIEKSCEFESILAEANVPHYQIGKVVENDNLSILGKNGTVLIRQSLSQLKFAWQKPFDLGNEY
ncbi:MAG: phosphoribosylformylglycinamidine synthase subunit PurS [Planctomycetia bacterium]|nr:phosphoribosylformylglycinamidine synthase subunit PurS [Planctomycetia bacterium]